MEFRGGGGTHSLAPAFTLAEVLVTLGIIGVISAMTLPTLVKNHQRQVYVTQLRKVVNEITQAVETAVVDHNAVSFREAHISDTNFLRNYFKTVKTCTDSEQDLKECFAYEYKNINGESIRLRDFTHGECAVLSDGTSMCLNTSTGYLNIGVDVNGKQGPNIYGRDLFSFIIDDKNNIKSAEYWINDNQLATECVSAKTMHMELVQASY